MLMQINICVFLFHCIYIWIFLLFSIIPIYFMCKNYKILNIKKKFHYKKLYFNNTYGNCLNTYTTYII